MSLDELIRSATSRAGVVRVRNVLNPILWLCAVTTPCCFLLPYILGSDAVLRYALASLGSLPVGVGLFSYVYFLLRAPNRLQSEEFVLRQQELTIIERKQAPPISLNMDLTDGSSMVIEKQTSNAQADPQ